MNNNNRGQVFLDAGGKVHRRQVRNFERHYLRKQSRSGNDSNESDDDAEDLVFPFEMLDLGPPELVQQDFVNSSDKEGSDDDGGGAFAEGGPPAPQPAPIPEEASEVAFLKVVDKSRFLEDCENVKLRNPYLPYQGDGADWDADLPMPPELEKDLKSGNQDPNVRDRNANLSETFSRANKRHFDDPTLVAEAICAARPDGVSFHGEWHEAGPNKGSKNKAFNSSADDAVKLLQSFLLVEYGLKVVGFGANNAIKDVVDRLANPSYSQAWSVNEIQKFAAFKPRAINKANRTTISLYCELCFSRLTRDECQKESPRFFLDRWNSIVVCQYINRLVENPDEHNATVRTTIDMTKLWFHDCQCTLPVHQRTHFQAKEMYFGSGDAIRLPIQRKDLFIGNMFDQILNGLEGAGPSPIGFRKEYSGLLRNPFSDHQVMDLPSRINHPRYFRSDEAFGIHQVCTIFCSALLIVGTSSTQSP